jgi:BirA family biotin operon repressor/biotin-[acetyl-CoA-carboxylase] ligase
MKNEILSILPGDHPWAEHLHIHEQLSSTNIELKQLAQAGAPQCTTVIAREQTAGRGRMGRSFYSQKDTGLYISCLLRPNCAPTDLMHLTCATGVAVTRATQKACGATPQIKWINDLVMGNKKLGGILTELSISPQTGLVEYAIVGIGINCLQDEFPEDLSQIATSLLLSTGATCSPARLAAFLIGELFDMAQTLLSDKNSWIESYRKSCITLNKEVMVHIGDHHFAATAKDIDADGSLVVLLPDGTEKILSSGEASVRGYWGYV